MSDATILDAKNEEHEAVETTGSVWVRATTLSVALSLAQHFAPIGDLTSSDIRMVQTDGTMTQAISAEITELDIIRQINRVFDDLLRNQVDLDIESKRVLYVNRWALYS